MLYFFEDPGAAQGMASVSRLILHASVDFLRPKDLRTVGNSNMHAFPDRVWLFTLKSENVGQKRLVRPSVMASPVAPDTNICLPALVR